MPKLIQSLTGVSDSYKLYCLFYKHSEAKTLVLASLTLSRKDQQTNPEIIHRFEILNC